jgi:putative flavoprotein involved in K+ transport
LPPPDATAPLIVGAGPGGLAAAWAIERAGLRPRVIERADRVCSSWYGHYESLRLNSPRSWSSLPGTAMDRRYGRWVARDDFIDYVSRYARRLRADVEFGVEASRVEREDDRWRVETSRGPIAASHVVVATGLNAVPHTPAWPGRESFAGELIHAKEYRNAEPFRGRDVLVAGIGASGMDISVDLARGGAGRVRVAVRNPPIIFRRTPMIAPMVLLMKYLGTSRRLADALTLAVHRLTWGDLSAYGIQSPTEGLATAMAKRTHAGTIDAGLVSAARKGAIEVVPAVEGFDGPDVILRDRRIRPDCVIAATGQRPALGPLVGHLGVLGEDGRPVVHGGECAESAPGLYFIGYRIPPGQLPDMRFDARAIARAVRRRTAGGEVRPGRGPQPARARGEPAASPA